MRKFGHLARGQRGRFVRTQLLLKTAQHGSCDLLHELLIIYAFAVVTNNTCRPYDRLRASCGCGQDLRAVTCEAVLHTTPGSAVAQPYSCMLHAACCTRVSPAAPVALVYLCQHIVIDRTGLGQQRRHQERVVRALLGHLQPAHRACGCQICRKPGSARRS